MHKYDLCCVGHITLDKVVTPDNTVHMPGGTSFYCSHAISHFNDIDYTLVAGLAESEMAVVEDLRSHGIEVKVVPSRKSVYFENIYSEDVDNSRQQRVLAKADPFTIDQLSDVDAKVYLLGALLADDFSVDIIKALSQKGKVAIDSQGYLREVRNQKVYAIDWKDKLEALKYVHVLKVNELELEALTGTDDVIKGGRMLYDWGVKEVLMTFGSMGSVIYDGENYYKIPAYVPKAVVDPTGCGDTYLIGYLYQRQKGASIEDAGRFAAAMASIKIEASGPFKKTKEDVVRVIETAEQHIPALQSLGI
jgi:sugar/nucleoside kinase (ribokinase family)